MSTLSAGASEPRRLGRPDAVFRQTGVKPAGSLRPLKSKALDPQADTAEKTHTSMVATANKKSRPDARGRRRILSKMFPIYPGVDYATNGR
jgi:hypothetical protein